jgi:hydroxylamine reductase (hybrid-cluster protein)
MSLTHGYSKAGYTWTTWWQQQVVNTGARKVVVAATNCCHSSPNGRIISFSSPNSISFERVYLKQWCAT